MNSRGSTASRLRASPRGPQARSVNDLRALAQPPAAGADVLDDGSGAATRTLLRGLAILDCFAAQGGKLTLQQIADTTGLAKATAFRLVHTLQAGGWLAQNERHEYVLAGKAAALSAASRGPDVLEVARPVMRELAERCGHSVTLHTLAGKRRLWLEAVATAPILRAIHFSKRPVPLCLGAATLALLASMPPLELQALLPEAAEGMNCPLAELESIIDTARRQGHAVSHGGGAEGITGIAAPIAAGRHGGVLCITIVLPTPAAKGLMVELTQLVKAAAADISHRLAPD